MKLKDKIKLWNEYHNPLYHWWKVRKEFKRPKCHFIFGKNLWWFGLYINKKFYNKFIHFRMSSVGYKWKYDEPRHEWDPFIQICLFQTYHFIWVFNWINKNDKNSSIKNMATWEAILRRIFLNDTLQESIEKNTWHDSEGNITIHDNVKQ